ncbi:MAG: DNA-binding protein [Leptolyngbyaceae bacterium]|nr:DNA-binding protein [Leptolyngbyaceae bacterium]
MANLIVRNIDDAIVQALKQRASRRGVSAEAEHRKILEQVLLHPAKISFAEALQLIPTIGKDSDFERVQNDTAKDVFD